MVLLVFVVLPSLARGGGLSGQDTLVMAQFCRSRAAAGAVKSVRPGLIRVVAAWCAAALVIT